MIRNSREKTAGRIRSKAGETIAETLVAILIAALALVMLAGSITAAKNIIQNNRTAFNTYYAQNEILMKQSESTGSTTIALKETGETGNLFSLSVDTFTNSSLGDTVTAYRIKNNGQTTP